MYEVENKWNLLEGFEQDQLSHRQIRSNVSLLLKIKWVEITHQF